jgi:tetratricopeptide (TPR) repeat protein
MIAYAQTMGAASMECLGLNLLATVYLNGSNGQQRALALLEQARAVAEQSEDRQGLAETEWNFAHAAIQDQKPRLALHHGERAVAIARELGHPQLLARCLTSLAQIYALRRQWEQAEAYVQESLKLYTAAGNLVLAAGSQRGLGFIQMFAGRPSESLLTLQETFGFSQKIENVWGVADCA